MKDNKPAICGGTPVRAEKLFYARQYIDDADIAAVVATLKSDFLTTGPQISSLEEKLCRITGAKYAVACANGTAALHMACLAAGIAEGDEVITTPLTFAASANCVLYCGGRPVFADVLPDTYCIDPQAVAAAVKAKTKAVIAVDYTGQSCDLDALRDICCERGLILMEDAAHSIGTKYRGKPVGSLADLTTFSFHAVKTVTGGEGGAVLTDNEEYYRRLRLFREHGITKQADLFVKPSSGAWYQEQIGLGYNYRLTDIQAALLVSQLDKLPLFVKRRKEIAARYDEAFAGLRGIGLQKEMAESDTARHLYLIRVIKGEMSIGRGEFFAALAAENVCCQVHYIPVYYHPYYEKLGYQKGLCPQAERIYEEIITLPLYYGMSDGDVADVIEAVRKVAEWYARL
ncbi:MAG: UDP-4-amino-4,6-dideoxy-N-acetyl-beta-L-altrosamine transaminase [Lachnospiraceae bacterium]|jgi:UDP-4-amino-4,6-dideoxy-N-acetyl-beta-L-altrosamine transaminase|nr:UDP-4-amino-4,6-dideoxy-N-acetyl-beta-L-altrosamine transaminase [Lachnospiraceae bacterium]